MKKEEFTLEHYLNKEEEKKARQRKYASDYYHRNKQTLAMNRVVSPDEIKRMLEKQSNMCAICTLNISDKPCIDHDHETGEIRGLLCRRCNMGLGYFSDDPVFLKSAIEYLKSYQRGEE